MREERKEEKNFYTPFRWFMLISGTGLVLACRSDSESYNGFGSWQSNCVMKSYAKLASFFFLFFFFFFFLNLFKSNDFYQTYATPFLVTCAIWFFVDFVNYVIKGQARCEWRKLHKIWTSNYWLSGKNQNISRY